MTFDYTVSLGAVMQLISICLGGGLIYGRMNTNLGFIKDELKRLAEVPLTLARHDERLKHLEKGDNVRS